MNIPISQPVSSCEAELDAPAPLDCAEFQQLLATLRIITLQQASMAFAAHG